MLIKILHLFPLIVIGFSAITSACTDSTTYTFDTYKAGVAFPRKCKWLTAKASKAAYRVAKFCPQTHSGSVVKDECINSCNNCPSDSPSLSPSASLPTHQPSEIPSGQPSMTFAPSSQPSTSMAPSPVALKCLDSETFKFITYKNGAPFNRKCKWLTQNSSKAAFRIQKFCKDTVEVECALSCDNCPTPKPSDMPSVQPSLTMMPSASPSRPPSPAPSPFPTARPSSQPSNASPWGKRVLVVGYCFSFFK